MSDSTGTLIAGQWAAGGGAPIVAKDPATGEAIFTASASSEAQVDAAVCSARAALELWAQSPLQQRTEILQRYAEGLKLSRIELALEISRHTGKPDWEALTEVDAMVAKVAISIEALNDRRKDSERQQSGATAATRYKPMGVMAVIGPFNMPEHLPNGHIVPALLAGNTVVFKPSELTPGVGVAMAKLLELAGLPAGVLNLVQGGKDVGAALIRHPEVDGILFTGSVAGGLAISKAVVDQPAKIVALEMGGNNPLVIWQANDLDAAAYLAIQSAFITSGQRCSCARRLIVPQGPDGDAILERLIGLMRRIRVAPHADRPEAFMGPVITDAAADNLLAAQQHLLSQGGISLIPLRSIGPTRAMLSPGLIDVTAVADRADEELFGPLLQVIRVVDFDAAVREANRTRFGLAAGLFSDNAELWQRFYSKIRAGVVYWNRQTTGGSSYLPFGGVGLSGNYRPSGYWAADYCSYPVASMEVPTLAMPAAKTPGVG
jgi:succinylglutamic semialdehyde dehydrogenase